MPATAAMPRVLPRVALDDFCCLITLLSKLSRSGIWDSHNDSPLAKFFLLGQSRLVIGRQVAVRE